MRTKLSSERKAKESKKKGKNFTYKTRIALCLFNKSVYTTSKIYNKLSCLRSLWQGTFSSPTFKAVEQDWLHPNNSASSWSIGGGVCPKQKAHDLSSKFGLIVNGILNVFVKKSCVVVLHMLTHMPVHPDSCNHLHFVICTLLAMFSFKSFSVVVSTVIGPTIHAKTIWQIFAFNSKLNLFSGNSFWNTFSPPGGINEVKMSMVICRCPSGSLPFIWRKHKVINAS